MNPIIKSERLLLRKWKEDDIPSLLSMNQDKEVMKYFLATLNELETTAFYNRIQEHFNKNGFGLYVVEDAIKHQFLGYTGFMIAEFESDFTPCIEIGWRFNKQYWGNGYATEAAQACIEYGFSELNFNTIYSFTSVYNNKSEAVMHRIGMKKIGEFKHPKIALDHPLCLHVNYVFEKA
jgi:RimJ/RimL family protein N-acetyltransferase